MSIMVCLPTAAEFRVKNIVTFSAPDKLRICVFYPIKMFKNAKKYNIMRIENATNLTFTQTRQMGCVQYNGFDRKCFSHLRYFLF